MVKEKPQLAAQVRFTVLNDEAIVIAQDDGRAHVVNQLGAFLLPLLNGRNSVEQLVGAVVEGFQVRKATARGDLEEFLSSLEDLNLLA